MKINVKYIPKHKTSEKKMQWSIKINVENKKNNKSEDLYKNKIENKN